MAENSNPPPADWRARVLARYVSTHAAVSGAAGNLDRRRPFLDKLIAEHFPPARDARGIDLGCGHGAIVWGARKLGYRNVEGVDASPEQVAMAATLKSDEIGAPRTFKLVAAVRSAIAAARSS